ncbi:hypothetical protein BJX61DRAFT_184953 [Aspergillus egyptiacus]|nr:hypothetical protein BJX61DRAFT_184953 [Aspergillus egyptiacus]
MRRLHSYDHRWTRSPGSGHSRLTQLHGPLRRLTSCPHTNKWRDLIVSCKNPSPPGWSCHRLSEIHPRCLGSGCCLPSTGKCLTSTRILLFTKCPIGQAVAHTIILELAHNPDSLVYGIIFLSELGNGPQQTMSIFCVYSSFHSPDQLYPNSYQLNHLNRPNLLCSDKYIDS